MTVPEGARVTDGEGSYYTVAYLAGDGVVPGKEDEEITIGLREQKMALLSGQLFSEAKANLGKGVDGVVPGKEDEEITIGLREQKLDLLSDQSLSKAKANLGKGVSGSGAVGSPSRGKQKELSEKAAAAPRPGAPAVPSKTDGGTPDLKQMPGFIGHLFDKAKAIPGKGGWTHILYFVLLVLLMLLFMARPVRAGGATPAGTGITNGAGGATPAGTGITNESAVGHLTVTCPKEKVAELLIISNKMGKELGTLTTKCVFTPVGDYENRVRLGSCLEGDEVKLELTLDQDESPYSFASGARLNNHSACNYTFSIQDEPENATTDAPPSADEPENATTDAPPSAGGSRNIIIICVIIGVILAAGVIAAIIYRRKHRGTYSIASQIELGEFSREKLASSWTPNGGGPGIPNGDGPGIPNGGGPGIPNGDGPGIPNGDGPGIPNGDGPGTPNGDGPGIPNGDGPGIPNGDGPGIPNGDGPGTPNGDGPGIPNGDGPGIPNGHPPGLLHS